MRMKILIFFAAISCATAKAQDIHWGVQGGLNLSGGIAKETGVTIKGNPALGYALGVVADISLPNSKWSIRPGLSFQHEASVAEIFGDNTHIRVNYFNLPIDLIYHPVFAGEAVGFRGRAMVRVWVIWEVYAGWVYVFYPVRV